MSSIEETIALLAAARDRLDRIAPAIMAVRQAGAEAAGYTQQALGTHEGAIGSLLSDMTSTANRVRELSNAASRLLSAEIVALPSGQ